MRGAEATDAEVRKGLTAIRCRIDIEQIQAALDRKLPNRRRAHVAAVYALCVAVRHDARIEQRTIASRARVAVGTAYNAIHAMLDLGTLHATESKLIREQDADGFWRVRSTCSEYKGGLVWSEDPAIEVRPCDRAMWEMIREARELGMPESTLLPLAKNWKTRELGQAIESAKARRRAAKVASPWIEHGDLISKSALKPPPMSEGRRAESNSEVILRKIESGNARARSKAPAGSRSKQPKRPRATGTKKAQPIHPILKPTLAAAAELGDNSPKAMCAQVVNLARQEEIPVVWAQAAYLQAAHEAKTGRSPNIEHPASWAAGRLRRIVGEYGEVGRPEAIWGSVSDNLDRRFGDTHLAARDWWNSAELVSIEPGRYVIGTDWTQDGGWERWEGLLAGEFERTVGVPTESVRIVAYEPRPRLPFRPPHSPLDEIPEEPKEIQRTWADKTDRDRLQETVRNHLGRPPSRHWFDAQLRSAEDGVFTLAFPHTPPEDPAEIGRWEDVYAKVTGLGDARMVPVLMTVDELREIGLLKYAAGRS